MKTKHELQNELRGKIYERTQNGMSYPQYHEMIMEVVTDAVVDLMVELRADFERLSGQVPPKTKD